MKFSLLLTSLLLMAQIAFAQEKPSEQLYQEAYENFVKRDYPAASASLDKINPVDQKKADVLNLRGAIYKRMGELDNAANAYTDALKINPKDWVPKYNLAEVNFLREQYKSSRGFLEQALSSMPESDRLQKQDLILYKVYLTYLMQGDDEKSKLLLDSFDINSANPVYYFAQAAWSFKNKDATKAKTWVSSTEGLYSQDLRNSYGQALVDIGWLEPSAGIGSNALSASPAATETPAATPATMAAASSPTPAAGDTASIVPLATNDATPIQVVEATTTPAAATPEASATPTPSIPEPMAVAESEKKDEKASSFKVWIPVLIVLGIAAVVLMKLAKSSRLVPPPEDNTGYAAIAASANPDASTAVAHSSEGTGVVMEQDFNGEVAPAAIKLSPIQREYAEPATAFSASESAPTTTTRRVPAPPAPATKSTRSKPSPKSVATTKATAPAKKTAVTKAPPAKVAPVPVPAVRLTKATKVAPAIAKKPVRPAAKPPAKPTMKTAAKPVEASVAPSPTIVAKSAPAAKSPAASKPAKTTTTTPTKTVAKTAAKTAAPASSLKTSRLVPITTINVPPPATPAPKLLASNIETIKLDASAPVRKPASKGKTTEKPVAAKLKPPVKSPAKSTPTRTTSPLITIPEFEDDNLQITPTPVIRLASDSTNSNESPASVDKI